MNISWDQTSSILRRMNTAGMLKSTQDRLERQEETQKQVDFFEKQKENLKNVSCGSVEEIAEKLKMFQSYEDQISSIKAAYNQEQMFHILDESTEAVEDTKPKTPEERLEEMVEEALGIEDGGELEEAMEELEEVVEELTEELVEETTEELTEAMPENAELSAEEVAKAAAATEAAEKEAANAKGIPEGYMPFDVRL